MHGRAPRRVRLHEELARRLAEVLDLVLDGLAHHAVRRRLEVDAALVRQVVEHVRRPNRLRTWSAQDGR